MTDKIKPVIGIKPVPMKLFATWEVDRTPPNCIPRLCSLTLSRLVVLKPLGSEVSSISIAVKMQHTRLLQGSRRTLRSNEMALPVNGLLDTELQLHFSLQYPHFLKRDGNKLHVMLQRRKRYKNRTILGYKTLADGVINMSQVLQKPSWYDLELDLYSDGKESKGHKNIIARLTVDSLNSQPVDYEGPIYAHQNARIGEYSDDDEEFSSNDDGSDSEPMLEDHSERKTSLPPNARQRNFKQKFISLLKRFRVNEDLHGLDSDRDNKLAGGDMDPAEIEDLFDEFDLSDSGPEMDTLSISSTPKPSLRPFFSSSSRSLLNDAHSQGGDINISNVDSASDRDSSTAYSMPRPHLKRFFSSSSQSLGLSDNHFQGGDWNIDVEAVPERDNLSTVSMPIPHLNRFFSSSKQSLYTDAHMQDSDSDIMDVDSEPLSDSTVYSMPRPHLKRFFSSSSQSLNTETRFQGDGGDSSPKRTISTCSIPRPFLKRLLSSTRRSLSTGFNFQD